MDTKTYSIGILSITALILLIANLIAPTALHADMVIKDRDYQMITARIQSGGDAVYVVDNRSGQMGVFTYDLRSRSLQPRNVRPVSDAFVIR